MQKVCFTRLWTIALLLATAIVPSAVAQFSGSVQGSITDSSGAAIPDAIVVLTNSDTHVTQTTKSSGSGVYRFISLAPGPYTVQVTASGFQAGKASLTLQTSENRDSSVTLGVEGSKQSITVSEHAPLIDTSDSRNQYTLDTQALSTLPLATRNPTAVLGITPGVTGGLDLQSNQNFNPEVYVDASANGRSENGNVYIIDGLEVTSNNRPGVITLIPTASAVQEETVQPNTFSVQYKGGSGLELIMTTKSGTDKFHGFASEYYNYQGLAARGEFGPSKTSTPNLPPYHTNNLAFGVGGPIWRKHKLYFFAYLQPYRSEGTNFSTLQFENPAFTAFAQSVRPNSVGSTVLKNYPIGAVSGRTTVQTAQDLFGPSNPTNNTGCNTPGTLNIPCSLPVIDQGQVALANFNTSRQYGVRLDKYFDKDRLYANFIRNRQQPGNGAARPAFNNTSQIYGVSFQGNETHTFNANTVNEAAFGYNRNEGFLVATSTFRVPVINVNGLGTGFGTGFAQGDFISNTYRWRDVLTRVIGRHTLKFGYDGYRGDDVSLKAPAYSAPTFQFSNLIDLVNDSPYAEYGLAYDLTSGKPKDGNYAYAIKTTGLFVEDTWKATNRLTMTLGVRYDNFGNAYPVGYSSIATAFHLGTGNSFQQQIANGSLGIQSHLLDRSLNWNFSPRVGAAMDLAGNGKWVARGGVGIYHQAIILGTQDGIALGNPPNFVTPTFFNNGSTARPIFALGTSDNYPFGFQYPALPGAKLDSKGGVVGSQVNIGGVQADAATPYTYNAFIGLEHQFFRNVTANIAYSASHSDGLLNGEGAQGAYGVGYDVNVYAGDLIQHLQCNTSNVCGGIQTRANTSFGAIAYAYNRNRANYKALIASVRGQLGQRAFLTASYTRSVAMDNQTYYIPTLTPDRFYGNAAFDVPHRGSAGFNYQFPGYKGNAFLSRLTGGFSTAGTVTLQSGTPLIVFTDAPFSAIRNPVTGALSYAPGSGDFLATGYNYAFPNLNAGATIPGSRARYKSGVFPDCRATLGSNLNGCGPFTLPTFGQNGNLPISGQFRNPAFAQTDLSVIKDTVLFESVSLQLRADAFNLFNQVNFYPLNGNANSGTFGRTTSTHTPRFLQLGVSLFF